MSRDARKIIYQHMIQQQGKKDCYIKGQFDCTEVDHETGDVLLNEIKKPGTDTHGDQDAVHEAISLAAARPNGIRVTITYFEPSPAQWEWYFSQYPDDKPGDSSPEPPPIETAPTPVAEPDTTIRPSREAVTQQSWVDELTRLRGIKRQAYRDANGSRTLFVELCSKNGIPSGFNKERGGSGDYFYIAAGADNLNFTKQGELRMLPRKGFPEACFFHCLKSNNRKIRSIKFLPVDEGWEAEFSFYD